MKPYSGRLLAALLPLACLSAACDLTVDSSLTKPDDAGADPEPDVADPDPDDVAPPARDGGAAGSDGAVEGDASKQPTQCYTGIIGCDTPPCPVQTADCPPVTPPEVQSCETDADCGSEQVCARQQCVARCSNELGCAGPLAERLVGRMLSVGDDVFWGTSAGQDASGNSLHNGTIWRLDASGATSAVATGFEAPTLWLAADGHLYFTEPVEQSASTMRRVRADGTGASATLLPDMRGVSSAWLTRDHVWWSADVESASGTIGRIPRAGAGSAEVFTTTIRYASSGNLTQLAYAAPTDGNALYARDLMVAKLDGSSPTHLGESAFLGWSLIEMDEHDVLATAYEDRYLTRFPLDGSAPLRLADAGTYMNRMAAHRNGDWVHWGYAAFDESIAPIRVAIGRSQRNLAWPMEELVSFTLPSSLSNENPAFAINGEGTRLAYFRNDERRVYTKDIKPYRCSAQALCPTGLACSDEGTCE